MKLPNQDLSIEQQVEEFDEWLTPQLERVKDTDTFSNELNSVTDAIDKLAEVMNNFQSRKDCTIDKLSSAVIGVSKSLMLGENFFDDTESVRKFIQSTFSLLFIVSGATDNNLKNHFKIKLKQDDFPTNFPKVSGKKTVKFKLEELPDVTKSDAVSKIISSTLVAYSKTYDDIKIKTEPAFNLFHYAELYLKEYASLILCDEEEFYQLWAICSSYITLKEKDERLGKYLINASTIFKVRGSVSATGGHIPEDLLREKLNLMGLERGIDFNLSDVVIGEQVIEEKGQRKPKTRAYDFVLPYERTGWKQHLFIQSQFYAGDSGSVSHKVVDQTTASRNFTREKISEKYGSADHIRFVEYLDGAGYFASLKGDLKHMLKFDDTHSFFQVRSIWIRLRRELQNIGFLTPIEIEHAVIRTPNGSIERIQEILINEGYEDKEIKRCLTYCFEKGLLVKIDDTAKLTPTRLELSRRLFILDIVANNGSAITTKEDRKRSILISGYGSHFGLNKASLSDIFEKQLLYKKPSISDFQNDIEWLLDEGAIEHHTV